MTLVSTGEAAILVPSADSAEPAGVRLHRFTVHEYHRMAEHGVFHKDDPTELLRGYLFIKLDYGPPYDVPLGIPPASIVGLDAPPYPQRRFTVREYHKLLNSGALPPQLRTELVEGWVVEKLTRNARHDSSLQRAADLLQERLPRKWKTRLQSAVAMDEGEPEPDLVIVPGPVGRYDNFHPRPSDVGLLIEISDSTLAYDRGSKLRDYARNGISKYWIVNLIDQVVEVYEDPSGPTAVPEYRIQRVHGAGESIALTLLDEVIDPIPVNQFMPGGK